MTKFTPPPPPKKKNLIFLFVFCFAFSASSQNFLESVRADIQTKIQHLSPNDVPTGILYDRTLPLSNLIGYGTPSGFAPLGPSVPSSSAGHYFLATEDLYRTDYLNRYPNPETLSANNQTAANIINIGIINADINKFKEDAFDIGALIVQGNDSLIYDNPNSSLSPYNTYKNVFVASTLKKKTGAKNIYFKLPSAFWKETAQFGITNLQIDFDNGNGFVTVTKNQTYYLFEEIEGNPQDPYPGGTGTYPSGGTYKVFPPNGFETSLQTGGGSNDLPGDPDPLNLPAAQMVTVWPDMPTRASNPVWTLINDDDNSLDSWSTSGSTLGFHYMNKNFNSIIDFRFTITDECGNPQSTPVRFTILENGGRPLPTDAFVVYPVPANDMITITNTQSGTPAIGAVLYDMFGQEKTANRSMDTNSLTLDVATIPEGLYILKIIAKDGTVVIKHFNIER